ncbi:MAG: collagen-like protein, partial [Bacilli bacterium]
MKKKNLLKCLALTSMLALSVGALASCGTQGAQGEKGDTGATGATGAPGKDGVDGKDGTNGTNGTDGKTYLPVIVLNNAVGTVSQDKYFVEVGESFTLSWENKGTGATLEVMSELKINGEAVDMEVGDSSYTYTAVDTDKGFQVTSCTYGTLIAYGEGLVTDHYDELADADKNLKTSEGVDQTGKLASYVGDDLYTQLGTSLAAITAADAPAKTVAERLALIKTAVATEITNIDTKYASLIKSAKEDAVADLKVMYAAPATPDTLDAAGRKDMTKADRAAMLTSATAEVNACTTLYGIGSLVKEDSAVNTYTDGKFNILEGNRKAAFTDVNGALAAVVTKDGVDGALDTAEHIAATRIVLADYGITELPSDVAASYITKISAASELPFVKDSTTDVALGKEGKKAVEDCYAGIISSLKDNIISIYYKEVEKSSVLDSNGKTTAKSLIFNTVTNWFADPTSTTTINGILDVDVPTSCVSSVEEALTNDNYTAYNIERKGWIVTENKAAIDEKIASIIAGDTVYSGLISAAATTDNHY